VTLIPFCSSDLMVCPAKKSCEIMRDERTTKRDTRARVEDEKEYTIREMRHRHNLQSALPVVVLSGHALVRAAHVAPWHLLCDASLAQTAGSATRVATKAS
jgi:hypothetical protein